MLIINNLTALSNIETIERDLRLNIYDDNGDRKTISSLGLSNIKFIGGTFDLNTTDANFDSDNLPLINFNTMTLRTAAVYGSRLNSIPRIKKIVNPECLLAFNDVCFLRKAIESNKIDSLDLRLFAGSGLCTPITKEQILANCK
jgi:hypothetical protein